MPYYSLYLIKIDTCHWYFTYKLGISLFNMDMDICIKKSSKLWRKINIKREYLYTTRH